jgi:hypothetical protein
MPTTTLATVLIALLSCCSTLGPIQTVANTGGKLSSAEFSALMRRQEKAWNSNDAKQAVDCFTEDALYSSPPNPRIRRGRTARFEFFGGLKGRPRPMRMEWAMKLGRPVFYPNGITLSDDANMLYIADILGVIRVDLRTNEAQDVKPAAHDTLAGIDGLYWFKSSNF